MLNDICHFRQQVWRLIIAICICINRWQKSVLFIQILKSSVYLDSVGISGVCLGSSGVMLAVKTRNIKGLGRDP